MSQLIIDRAILEALFERAVSAARRVSCIEDKVAHDLDVGDVDPLADEIDAIAHDLSELLGNPDLIAAHVPRARTTFEYGAVTRADVVTRGSVPEFVSPDVPTVPSVDAFSLGIPTPYTALANEREASHASHAYARPLLPDGNPGDEFTPVPDPIKGVVAFTEDESTRPRVRRIRSTYGHQCQRGEKAPRARGAAAVHTWRAQSQRAQAIEDARSAARWMRGATIVALIVLVVLVLRFAMSNVIIGATASAVEAAGQAGDKLAAQLASRQGA